MRLAHLRNEFAKAAAVGERLTSSGADPENAARDFNLLGIATTRSAITTGRVARSRPRCRSHLARLPC